MNVKYIEIDGIDFCGKTTQVELAYQFMRHNLGLKVWKTQQPTKFSLASQQIDEILSTSKNPREHAKELTDLFIADRISSLRQTGLYLADGVSVVCSRGRLSTYAYQTAQGIEFDYIRGLHDNLLEPNLTIILDLPVNAALARKAAAKRTRVDVFEKDKKFLAQVKTNYDNLRKMLNDDTIITINGHRSIELIRRDIQAKLEKLFGH
ncbi:MAG: dTMP kinase [Nanoarchaeota archaeon]